MTGPGNGGGGTPIGRLLALALGGLVLLAAVPVLVLGYIGAEDNTGRLLRDRGEMSIDNVVEQIATYLDPPRHQLEYIQGAVASGRIEIGSPRDREWSSFVLGALAATPQVTGIGHILPDGTLHRFTRDDLGIHLGNAGVTAPLFESLEAARASGSPQWLDAVWTPVLNQTLLRLVAPLNEPDGTFRGAIVAVVTTSTLSRYLKQVSDQGAPTAFILAGLDRVVAHPRLADRAFASRLLSETPLPGIEEIGDPVLLELWSEDREPLTALAPFREAEGHWTWVGGATYAYVYRTVVGYGGEPWTVGVYLPGSESARERWIVQGIAVGGLALLCFALAAAAIIGRRLGRPILGLAAAAERIEALDFEAVRQLPRGAIREVNRAAGAFERMAAGLRLFETYVPRALVRRLIAAGAERPESELREVTILFTDLENYTGLSAGRPAAEIAAYLNEVLACIGPLIEAGGGTIDNLMGDAVMALWGAPEPRADHADAACRTALAIAEAVERLNAARRAGGLPACRLRIGIHTGAAVVGNIGFEGRVHYTIIGEAVNTAQRVEQLGRQVEAEEAETTILASRQTREATAEPFAFEMAFERLDGRLEAAAPVFQLGSGGG